MLSEITNAILQVIIFTLIPLIVYLLRFKTVKGFFNHIGLKSANRKAIIMAILISILLFMPMLIMVLFMPDFKDIMHAPSSMTGKFKMMGPSVEGILLLLIGAIFKTALSEEILFRGFIAKRLIAVSSYKTGNIIQATLFGAIHVLIFLSITSNIFFLMIMFIVPALGAYLKTYINEKKAGGSILPGWIMHATSNLQSYSIIGFLV